MTVAAREAGAPGPRKKPFFSSSHMSEATFAYLLIIPVVIVLVAIMIYPTIYSLWMSFHYVDVLGDGAWEWIGLENYEYALTNQDLINSIVRTIQYTVYVTIFAMILAIGGALLLNEQFKGRKYLLVLVILPWSVSTYAAAAIFRYMYNPQFGLFNSILMNLGIVTPETAIQFVDEKLVLISIAVAHAWQFSPLGMYFLLAVMQVIPQDVYKVAKTDRLGVFGRFRNVTWPYIRLPVLIYVVLVTAEAAKVFDIIYFISGGGPGKSSHDLVYQIYVESFTNWNFGYGAAISWILVVLIMIITTLYFITILRREKEEVQLRVDDAEVSWKQHNLGISSGTPREGTPGSAD